MAEGPQEILLGDREMETSFDVSVIPEDRIQGLISDVMERMRKIGLQNVRLIESSKGEKEKAMIRLRSVRPEDSPSHEMASEIGIQVILATGAVGIPWNPATVDTSWK